MSNFREQQAIFKAIKDIEPIPELVHKTSLEYIVSSVGEVLHPIIKDNDVIIVTGSYFGDEGKGKKTDAVANDPLIEIIARFNSGENAGHTVCHDGKKYVFHLTPSAVTIPGKTCVIGPECVMDPINYLDKEISQLIKAGVDYKNKLLMGNVHIVTPYYKILDFVVNPSNSSTLKGISPAHSSKVWKRGLRLDDLFNSEKNQIKRLSEDVEIYFAFLKQKGFDESELIKKFEKLAADGREVPDHIIGFLKADNKVDYLVKLYKEQVSNNHDFPKRTDVTQLIRNTLKKGKKILIESPQSYWLSNATEKHWKSSTSAQTHAAGVIASGLFNISKYKIAIINVAKTPSDSRVGRGANPSSFVHQTYFSDKKINSLDELGNACMDFDSIQRQYFKSIRPNGILEPTLFTDSTGTYCINEAMAIASSRQFGEKGSTTDKPRITGVFDCVAAAQVNEAQGPYLFVSALDRGDYQDFVGLAVAYVYHNPSGEPADSNGKIYKNGDIIRIKDQYPCDNVLRYCHPIIKVMPGWKDTPIRADKRKQDDPLPKSVQNFLGTIEDLTGFRVISIGNGTDTKNMIYVKRK